jgi:hypothetical protein
MPDLKNRDMDEIESSESYRRGDVSMTRASRPCGKCGISNSIELDFQNALHGL